MGFGQDRDGPNASALMRHTSTVSTNCVMPFNFLRTRSETALSNAFPPRLAVSSLTPAEDQSVSHEIGFTGPSMPSIHSVFMIPTEQTNTLDCVTHGPGTCAPGGAASLSGDDPGHSGLVGTHGAGSPFNWQG